jgi:hypothetical protein
MRAAVGGRVAEAWPFVAIVLHMKGISVARRSEPDGRQNHSAAPGFPSSLS